ncbi:MAG: TRAP transporter TatT component family protein [Elusimicrobia bacterium]|nr:TRAP transporter TatT component family protein [Elusimicrobiota bacterium]
MKRGLLSALLLSCLPAGARGAAAASAAFSEVDRLYRHRDQDRNLDRSTALVEAGLKSRPEDGAALWRLGRNLVRQGESRESKAEKLELFTRAEAVLRRATAAAPDDPSAYYWLGVAMGRRGQVRGMLKSMFLVGPLRRLMRKAIELDPEFGGAYHFLGEMDLEIPRWAGGSRTEAVREFETAVRLEPNVSVHLVALAEAYYEVGERDKAKAALERVLAIQDPGDPAEYPDDADKARELLKKL